MSVSWCAARGTDPNRAAVNVITPNDNNFEKTRTRTGPAKAAKDRPSRRFCVRSSRRTYLTGDASPAVPSFFAAKRARTTACTTWDRAVASAAPRTPRPNTPTAMRPKNIGVATPERDQRRRRVLRTQQCRRQRVAQQEKGRAEGPYAHVRRRALLHLERAGRLSTNKDGQERSCYEPQPDQRQHAVP